MKKEYNEKSKEKSKPTNNSTLSGYGLGIKISTDLIASVTVGVLIGLGMDKLFSTKPIFFIIFLLLGIIAGFYNIYKSFKRLNNF